VGFFHNVFIEHSVLLFPKSKPFSELSLLVKNTSQENVENRDADSDQTWNYPNIVFVEQSFVDMGSDTDPDH